MASSITSNTTTPTTTATTTDGTTSTAVNPDGILNKDDFLKLLLVELQYQDPTEPMDSEKILTQTSQLASLESANNTNTALEKLSESLITSMQFSTISAIGKMADLGSDSIKLDAEGGNSAFDIYFPKDISSAQVEIRDGDGALVRTFDVAASPKGVQNFTWDGITVGGSAAKEGVYHISANYVGSDGTTGSSKLGSYPIESIRFEEGQPLAKVGSSYVPFDSIYEVY